MTPQKVINIYINLWCESYQFPFKPSSYLPKDHPFDLYKYLKKVCKFNFFYYFCRKYYKYDKTRTYLRRHSTCTRVFGN